MWGKGVFRLHLGLHRETTRNSERKGEVREGHLEGGVQSVISKANLEVQECLPMSKLFNQEKRSKEKRVTLVKLVKWRQCRMWTLNTWGSCFFWFLTLSGLTKTTASLSDVTLLASRTGAMSLSVSA